MILEYWNYWTGLTGGDVLLTGSGTLVDDVYNAVVTGLTTPEVTNLTLKASAGYESWLVSVNPPSYSGPTGVTVDFDIEIKVPDGTADGTYSFTISAVDAAGVNYGDQEVTITVESVIKVKIDIKPGSFPNSINRNNKGNVPVAILGSETFDVTAVDRDTVVFAGANALPIGGSPEDVNGDGYLDLVLHFATQELSLADDATKACLKGKTLSGKDFEGCDSVRIVK
jgi:hypothetical protein